MRLREKVLSALSDAGAEGLSGEALAKRFGVSRAAVWKAVRALKFEGYGINGEAGSGYRLISAPDILSATEISRRMSHRDIPVIFARETDSALSMARGYVSETAGDTALFVAERQTGGRGRLGRSFFSPPGGIYLCYRFCPSLTGHGSAMLITAAACTAVCEAIEEICGINTGIKWVNDVYVGGKKVCGILTEATWCAETGCMDAVYIGVGINFNIPASSFPEELKGIAGSLFDGVIPPVTRAELIAAVTDRLALVEERCLSADFLDGYRRRSTVLGKAVRCFRGNDEFPARAVAVDDMCGLVVRLDDGTLMTLNSGEVSVRTEGTPPPVPEKAQGNRHLQTKI